MIIILIIFFVSTSFLLYSLIVRNMMNKFLIKKGWKRIMSIDWNCNLIISYEKDGNRLSLWEAYRKEINLIK